MKVYILLALITIAAAMTMLGPDFITAGEGEIILSVPGIPGPYCAYGLEKRLLELEGVERVDLLWREEKIRIVVIKDNRVTPDEIREAVRWADYPYQYTIMP
ncbi:MAG: heavy-metal-associated domain-containing protein [Nitrospirae bacterium]|nr:heavy-metal-associated domain-containing protein [Nitrospirota bacterium]